MSLKNGGATYAWPSGHLLPKRTEQMAKQRDQVVNLGHLYKYIIINNIYISDGQMAKVYRVFVFFKKIADGQNLKNLATWSREFGHLAFLKR